ncbi:MAG: hypothetical protein CVV64_07805 [Candidatus Wallbacteria bacterium HGW-Wallbacteria-1]|jgi:molybdate/tungstate transport system substrate-binding protein|uniref:Tungstate ABC transporter substrate-binding protein WtpA n=1 Tax=Candidatus Wallbacteria bacterium HGW-Wallbacteria-1 TaxID=2013854 RepID=A0A2N1PR03_9BACT|nr:MAG: hypothetical protein CVV64_07805 [Candidatus Wallbacteria bacterium HGW-Wallbacteria-1]
MVYDKRCLKKPSAAFFLIGVLISTALILTILGGCFKGSEQRIRIFAASSLAAPLEDLCSRFTERTGIQIAREYSGSHLAIRKVEELGRQAEIVISADTDLIESYMLGSSASWYMEFLGGSMVLAFTDSSRFSSDINETNWYRVLLRDEVSIGVTRTDVEPAGYRAVLALELAEKHYGVPGLATEILGRIPLSNVKHDVAALIAPLQAQVFDYVFTYRSLALQHRLKYVTLPVEIDLSSSSLNSQYSQVTCPISIPGRKDVTVTGKAVSYGLVVLEEDTKSEGQNKEGSISDLSVDRIKNGTREFIGFLLSAQAREVWEFHGQATLPEIRCHSESGKGLPDWVMALAK